MKNLLLLIILIALVSCGGTKKNQANDVSAENVEVSDDIQIFDDGHYAENSLDYWGVYKGMPPTVGSPIELILTLDKEGTFNLIEHHIDSDKSVEKKGTYTLEKSYLSLIYDDEEDVDYYFIGENSATILSPDREFIEGELATQYVLTKVE